VRRHAAHGLCSPCYQRDPAIIGVWAQGSTSRLGESCPVWFGALVDYLLARCAPAVCLRHLRRIEHALAAGQTRPAALLAAVIDRGRSARSPGSTARLLEGFLVGRGLLLASDEQGRLAAGRRQRRLERCPAVLRPMVERYLAATLDASQRARRRGEQPLRDGTIERRLVIIAAFATHLRDLGVTDWAAVSSEHVESFLAARISRSGPLASLRDLFRWARRERLVLSDPTRGLTDTPAPGFAGRTLSITEQAELTKRWSGEECHPNEALVGMLALLHGASSTELRGLRISDLDPVTRTLRLGSRRHRVPLDPLSIKAIERCLEHRASLQTENPHLILTRCTRCHHTAASTAYLAHVLDPAAVTPRLLRQTRLADLAHRIDPRLVAEAFGITAEGALHYLIGAVEREEHALTNI
jgi:integrase